ncbi:MAG TPA: AAA family ATPase [Acidimicrobiales bacterium]|nr:AAA family ATPase [Acidimicrobiales bacterium]
MATKAPLPAAVAETHSGVVFFLGDRAYKVKKPVDLGFLDFRTREARLDACRREVALNRRLAPDVYLGVADIRGPGGRPCDHAVVMRRMPGDRRLSSMITSGVPVNEHLARLATQLAAFHARAERSPSIDEMARRDTILRRWEKNHAEMAEFPSTVLDPEVLDEAMTLARRYLAGRTPLFEQRIAERRPCDGHGDLLADDIFCLDDGPRVLDCLEFDDRLRYGDTLADVAFLAMDLERLGREDLASAFLAHYQDASGDSWPPSLAHHYIAYRAQVRAKVAAVRWAQGDTPSAQAAGELVALGGEHLRRGRVRLILVGGHPGTGKSTVARGIAAPLDALVLRSDEVRKSLAGLDPLTPAPAPVEEELYRPAMTDATYTELLAQARTGLELGRTVVLDATWRDRRWRDAAAGVAAAATADLVELRCAAPLDLALERIRRRSGRDASDATEVVARAMWAGGEPWITAAEIDTSSDGSAAVANALAAADR